MIELPNWAATAVEVAIYVFFGPFLVLCAAFALASLFAPAVWALWGKASPIDRILVVLTYFLLAAGIILKAL